MFKLVVLFSVTALAAANPSGWLEHGAILPGGTSVSAYDTSIVHPSPVYHRAPIVHHTPLVVAPVQLHHHLHKRSIGIAPVSYSTIVSHAPFYSPWGVGYGHGTSYGYGARHAAPWYSLGYATAYPTALHPY